MSKEKLEWNPEREKYWMGQAIFCQDGVNMLGIASALHRMIKEMKTEPMMTPDAVNQHPATVLFIGKIYNLAEYDAMKFHHAYTECMKRAKDLVHEQNLKEEKEDANENG